MKFFYALFLLIILAAVGYALFDSPHEFSAEECKSCHAGMPNPGQKSPLPMIGKVRTLCSRCHSNVVRKYSHPDEVAPDKARVPADMPLSAEKKLTCATCHDIHTSLEWSKMVSLLRRPVTGMEFCSTCHEENPGEVSHTRVLAFAHGAGSKYIRTNPSGTLDSLSIQCLSCHDSSIGKGDSIVGAGFWTHSKDLAQHLGGHPIGVYYDESRARDPEGYKPKASIAPLRLFSGKIGCGSCHDPYSTRANKLIMSNAGSGLCLRCHNR
ncbi:MAG: cytochrome c3 family protein [Nitrospirota bacterium]